MKRFAQYIIEGVGTKEIQDFVSDIKNTITSIFPKSFLSVKYSENLGKSIFINFGINDKIDVTIHNDPAHISVILIDANDVDTFDLNKLTIDSSINGIMIKPENNYVAYSRIKYPFRKYTGTKDKIIEKIKTYFTGLKQTLKDNIDKMTDEHKKIVADKIKE